MGVVILAWEFFPAQTIIWDGGFDLTVDVVCDVERFQSVSCQAIGTQEDAEFALRNLIPLETLSHSAVADPFHGQPLIVDVPLSGRDSPLGREIRRFQFQHLLVIGQLKSGERIGKLAAIPDGRKSRHVTVVLP